MSDVQTVRLAPPGAGVPAIERFVGGTLVAMRRRRSPSRHLADFAQQREAIAGLCRGQAEDTLARRTLIPRLRGLEDSSRNWSVLMTLDHLRIVNNEIARVIGMLVQGRVPESAASIAAVKPRPDAGPEAVSAYEDSCDRWIAAMASHQDLRTRVRYAHPWFGPLDAAGWQALVVMHMGIHRNQIARILRVREGRPREAADQA